MLQIQDKNQSLSDQERSFDNSDKIHEIKIIRNNALILLVT